jgi:3-methyladenine DNA glycosylase AlkD
MAAIELLVARPALVGPGDLPWIEHTLRECGSWALVDPLAGWVVSGLALREPELVLPVLDRWVGDPDFWVRRAAVLGLGRLLRQDRELDRFFAYAGRLLPEREFFIRKVLGWVLREVAVRHPAEVSAWLRAHMSGMNLVTLREPLRKLPDAAELRACYDGGGRRRNAPG